MLSLVAVSLGLGTGLISSGTAHAAQIGIGISNSNDSSEQLLEEKSGKAFLGEHLAAVEQLKSSDYTTETWAPLWDTYQKAKQADANPFTSDMMLRSWGASLVVAMNNLQEVSILPINSVSINPYTVGDTELTGTYTDNESLTHLAVFINGGLSGIYNMGDFKDNTFNLKWINASSITENSNVEVVAFDAQNNEVSRVKVAVKG